MNAIFAVNSVDSFGTGQDMPWPRSSVDMKRFRELTTNHTVVMGSTTWLSDMPKPLPNRRNVVLSTKLVDDRCEVFGSVTDFMMNTKADENIFIIGGVKVLYSFKVFINKIYLTRFKYTDEAPVKLDTTAYLTGFKLESLEEFGDHTFEIYTKN